ncbi:MAG: hypothetical protein ACRDIB_19615, partial [Ardenticatenaceae bacterium]
MGPGAGIMFQVEPLGAAFLLLIGLVGIGTFVGSLDEQETVVNEEYQAGLLTLLGGLAALALADSLLTLLLAALLVDIGLILGMGLSGRPRWLLVTLIHALVAQGLTLTAMLLLWRESGAATLAGASDPVINMLVFAAVARMAPLPLSLFPIAFESLPQRVRALLPLATVGAGSLWLGRVAQAAGPDGLPDLDKLAGVAAVGVALAGWVAWRQREPTVRLMMLSAAQAAWVIWAFVWGLPAVAVATAWGGVLALAALAIHGGRLDFRHGAQLPGLVACLMLAGLPGSALWRAATLLGGQAWQRELHSWLALGAIGMMTTIACLVEWMMPEEYEPHQHSRWTGAILLSALSVPFIGVLWGIRVPALPGGVGALEGSTGPLVAQVALPVLGWAGGLLLW